MFGIALFISFLDHLKYEKGSIIKIILYVTIIICAPIIFFDNYYSSVYIDAILGLTFGFLLLKILAQKEKYEIFDILVISLGLFILILEKDVGIFLALIILIIYFVDMIFFKNKEEFKNMNKKKAIKLVAYILLPILGIIIAKYSWSYLIKVNNAEVMFSRKI